MDATTQPKANAQPEGLKVWLNVMNSTLTALEQTLWQGRELAEQAIKAVGRLEHEYNAIGEGISNWKEQVDRLSKTGWMLTKITSRYRLWGIKSAFISRRRIPKELNKLHRKNALLFRDVSLEQGGAFLKVGQLLSARADILPEAWIEELRVLQDQTTPECFDDIRNTIESELNQSMENIFDHFDEEPIAAASIGQVHKAVLKDGRTVAVKIQRPGLENIINLDMQLLKLFMNSIESLLPPTDIETITTEVERTIREELDYNHEARWMNRIAEDLSDVEGVVVPKAILSHSTKKVMVTNFIEGKPLASELDHRHEQNDADGVSDLLGRLLDLYLRQVLQFGVFQADPHPGNLLVTHDNKLVLLDFGCTMVLSDRFRDGYGKVLGAALMDEREEMARELMEMGFQTRSGKPDTLLFFADALLGQIMKALNGMSKGQMEWPSPQQMIEGGKKLMEQADRDPVDKLPAEFIMLARVFTTLGGLFTHYKPNLDVHRYLIPHMVAPALSQVL